MYRVSPLMLRSSHILLRRPTGLQVVSVCHTPSAYKHYKTFDEPEREPCPPKNPIPPCPPPPPNRNFLWTTIAFFVLFGFATVKAKNSKEFRDWVTIYAPWFDDYVAAILQENKPITESLKDFVEYGKHYFQDMTKPLPDECTVDGKHVGGIKAPVCPKPCNHPPKKEPPPVVVEDEDGGPPCTLIPKSKITKDVCEIEDCIKEVGEDIYNNYLTGRDACIFYNTLVINAMKKYNFDAVAELKKEKKIRLELVNKSLKNVETGQKQLADLVEYVECGCNASEERLVKTKKLLKETMDKIETVRIDFVRENQRASQRDLQWQIVEAYVNTFTERMSLMYPEIDFHSKKPQIKGDIDMYLLIYQKYMDGLKKQVIAAEDQMVKRADRSVKLMDNRKPPPDKNAKKGKDDKSAEEKAKEAYLKAFADINKEFDEREKILKQENEAELKAALKIQKDEFEKTLEKKLAEKVEQVQKRFIKGVAEKVAAQKKIFDDDLNEMRRQVAIVEDKLEAKRKAERESDRARDLYTAGMALLRATRRGEPRVCVKKELQALQKASKSVDGPDPLVVTVLNAIPRDVWENGIVPESVLRNRYNQMEDVAEKVAMVETEGSPLPVYAFSWIQAQLISFLKVCTVPQSELDNPPSEPFEDLDTFDLLQRARYFVEHGNLARAMRYVDALQGASRAAAEGWHSAASAHLQARQAAEAILAHAAAICLQYL